MGSLTIPMYLMAGLWLAWAVGALSSDFVRSLSVTLADFLGAAMLVGLAYRSPSVVRPPLLGLALGLAVLGAGDFLLSLTRLNPGFTSADGLREGLYLLSALLVLAMGALLPWAMERNGLYPQGNALRFTLIAALAAALLVMFVQAFRDSSALNMLFQGVVFFLTVLYLQQTAVLAGGRIARSLSALSLALVLVSLARVVPVLGGDARWVTVLYDLFWLGGISLLVWTGSRVAIPTRGPSLGATPTPRKP